MLRYPIYYNSDRKMNRQMEFALCEWSRGYGRKRVEGASHRMRGSFAYIWEANILELRNYSRGGRWTADAQWRSTQTVFETDGKANYSIYIGEI